MTARILLIEDDPGIRTAVKDELEFEGFDVDIAVDGLSGLDLVLRSPPDLIVLDLMLPGRNGFQVCQELRSRGVRTPVVVLTARGQEVDKIRGFEVGADDYLTKPFSLAELVARIRAVLRRTQRDGGGDVLQSGSVRVDVRRHRAYKGSAELQLTDTEFRILALLITRAGEVVTRDDFLREVWGEEVNVTHRTVDTHVAALRRKIEDDLQRPTLIVSVRNAGYRFDETFTPT